MKHYLSVLGVVAALWAPAAVVAQTSPPPVHQQTSGPTDARFEVIQSTILARLIFRLDRFTGRVWQLARTDDENFIWDETEVGDRPTPTQSKRPHFMIFTSGFAVRQTFLMDTDTGKSWLLVTAKRKSSSGSEYDATLWQPFAD